LGGAAIGSPEGALLAMGYPHKPHQISIIDLPPDERLYGPRGAEAANTYVTVDGIHVDYHYSSMTDMSPFADNSIDLVWSGESIEHISEVEGDLVCQEAYRILKPGGYFCLDTPNAALTRIKSPDEFIHPEHQKEYLVSELRDKLARCGFEVVEEKGLCAMLNTLQTGQFDHRELACNISVSDHAESGYLFYLKAMKPFAT